MISKLCSAIVLLLGLVVVYSIPQGVYQGASQQPQNLLNLGFENVRPGKYALVNLGYGTWDQAKAACERLVPGGQLFTVDSPKDSFWLGSRINLEKDRASGSSKFWVGFQSNPYVGTLSWLSGSTRYQYPETVQTSGYDDETKVVAWAVPDSGTSLKYEFLTKDDEAEAFICQYLL